MLVSMSQNQSMIAILLIPTELLFEDVFTFENSKIGFLHLLNKIPTKSPENIKIGLESTGHFSNNLVSLLSEIGFSLTLSIR